MVYTVLSAFLIVGSIHYGGPIELFQVPTSGPQLVYHRPWYVLFCLWKSCGPLVGTENSPNCSWVLLEGSIRRPTASKAGTLSTELHPAPI